jgi:hypothetical protein
MLVIGMPCTFLVVVVKGESMICFLLINFTEDREIHGLITDLASGIFVVANRGLVSAAVTEV